MSITTTTFVTATASTSSSSAITKTAISSPSSLLWNTRMTTTKTNRMLKSCNDKNKNNNNNKNSDSLSFLVSSSIRLGLRSALVSSSSSPFATPTTTTPKSSSFCSSRTVSVKKKKKKKKVSTTDFLGSDSSLLPSSISWFRKKEQPKQQQQQQHPNLQYYVDSNNDHDETEVEKENKVDDTTIVESAFFRTTRRTKNKNDGSSSLSSSSLLHDDDDDDNNNSIRSMRSAFLFQRAMNSNNKQKKKTTTTATTTIDYDDDDDETIDDELQFLESSIRCHQRNIPASARCTTPVITCDDRTSSVYNNDVDLTVNADIHPSSPYNNNNDHYHHHRLNPSDNNNKKQQQQQQLVDDYNNVIMASIRSNRNIQKTLALIPPDLRAGAVNALASAIAVTTSRPLAFWESMVCGAISRSVAQTTMHPANTMKTILQNTRAGSSSSDLNFIELMKPKNFRMLTRGAGANFLLSVPHGAINFAVLEFVRKQLGFAISKNEYLRQNENKFSAGLDFFSSAISTITCSIVSTPQMMITDNIMAGNYPNLISAIRGLAKNGNGIRGFYAGWWPGLVGKIPSYALTWTIFQQLKLARDRINSDRPANDIENSIMGCVASATTVCIMIPLDTIKTRLVTQAGRAATSDVAAYKGIIDCAVRIIQEEGIRTFYRGLPPRLISVVPMIGIQFGVYEFMKRIMLQRKIEIKTIQLLKELQRGKEYGTYEVLEEALMECAASLDQPYPAPHFLHDVNKKEEDDDDDEAKQQQQQQQEKKNTTSKKEESAAKKIKKKQKIN